MNQPQIKPDPGAAIPMQGGTMKIKVYTASKLNYAPIWRRLRDEHPELDIVARWPFLHVGNEGQPGWPHECPAHGSIFWQHDHEDVARCDVVLVATRVGDVLKGALIEAGIGIALWKNRDRSRRQRFIRHVAIPHSVQACGGYGSGPVLDAFDRVRSTRREPTHD